MNSQTVANSVILHIFKSVSNFVSIVPANLESSYNLTIMDDIMMSELRISN